MKGRLTKSGQLRLRHNAMKRVCQLGPYCWSLRLIGPEERRSDTDNGSRDGSQRYGESLRAHPFQPAYTEIGMKGRRGTPIRERLLPQPFALGPRTFFRYAHQHSSPAMSIPDHPSDLSLWEVEGNIVARNGESLRAHRFQPADSGAVMQDFVVAVKIALPYCHDEPYGESLVWTALSGIPLDRGPIQ